MRDDRDQLDQELRQRFERHRQEPPPDTLRRALEPAHRRDIEERARPAPAVRRSVESTENREPPPRRLRDRFSEIVMKTLNAVTSTDDDTEFSVETKEAVTVMPVLKFKMALGTA